MRLRRIATASAVAAAAAATVLATTAALSLAAPGDPMQPLPALTSQALAARYATDSAAIARAAGSAQRSGDPALARSLDALRGRHFLSFDPRGPGEAIEVLGDLATATRVAVLVPGSDTFLATFGSRGTASPAGAAAALAAQAHRLDPGARLAVVAWLGYSTPATLSPGVLTSGDAGQGASALRPFVTDLARHGARVALLCHSYGTVVCGLAAPHLPVTDIAVFGSPGMDVALAILWAVFHRAERRPVPAARGPGRGGKMAGRERGSPHSLEAR